MHRMSYAYSSETFLTSSTQREPGKPCFDMQRDFFDPLSQGDIERAADVFARDGVLLFPGVRAMQGQALVRRMLGIIRRRYQEITWRPIGPFIGSDGWTVTSWSVSGTFTHTGLPYENEVLSLVRLNQDGKIAILSDYFKDTLAFSPPRAETASRQLTAAA